MHDLSVVHQQKSPDSTESPRRARPEDALLVDTCQRRVWIATGTRVPRDPGAASEQYAGPDAYAFLLRFATGLLSAVPAETQVFAQLKHAWREFLRARNAPVPAEFRRLMEGLFADTKRIRRDYLQHIGGTGYGRLARRLLQVRRGDPVLIVGSGALAHAVSAGFRHTPLAGWSRFPDAGQLPGTRRGFGPGEEAAACAWARHIIFCTPPGLVMEPGWIDAAGQAGVGSILHLGYRRTPEEWRVLDGFRNLQDLFDLQQLRRSVQPLMLARAHRACTAIAARRAARHIAGAPAEAIAS